MDLITIGFKDGQIHNYFINIENRGGSQETGGGKEEGNDESNDSDKNAHVDGTVIMYRAFE